MCSFICGVGVRAGGARAPGAPYVAGPALMYTNYSLRNVSLSKSVMYI